MIYNFIISGYLKHEYGYLLSFTEYNDIIRRKISHLSIHTKDSAEVNLYKIQSRERAKKSRYKRKLDNSEDDKGSKKPKSKSLFFKNLILWCFLSHTVCFLIKIFSIFNFPLRKLKIFKKREDIGFPNFLFSVRDKLSLSICFLLPLSHLCMFIFFQSL